MDWHGVIAAAEGGFLGGLFIGLLIGLFLGLLVGPILRSWLAWREWVEASREADLTERFLARWEEEARPHPQLPSPAPQAKRSSAAMWDRQDPTG